MGFLLFLKVELMSFLYAEYLSIFSIYFLILLIWGLSLKLVVVEIIPRTSQAPSRHWEFCDHLEMTPLESEIHPIEIPFCCEFSTLLLHILKNYDQWKYCYLLPIAAITWEFPGRFPQPWEFHWLLLPGRVSIGFGTTGSRGHTCRLLWNPLSVPWHNFPGCAVFEGQLETGSIEFWRVLSTWYAHIIILCLYNSFMMFVSGIGIRYGYLPAKYTNCSWVFTWGMNTTWIPFLSPT